MTNTNEMNKNAKQIIQDLLCISADLQRVGNRIAGEYGLKQQQFVVLNEIVMKGKINQKQIVGELLYEKSNVSKIVKKLKSLGLIEMTLSPEDKRVTILRATGSGMRVWTECLNKFDTWNRNWIKPLTKDEITQAMLILKRLRELL